MTEPKPKKDRRRHLSTNILVVGCLVLSVILTVYIYAYYVAQRDKQIEANASVDVFRTMNVKQLDGSSFTSEDLKNTKLTVLNVWETTCPACIGEFPTLEEISKELDPSEIQIIGLCHDTVDKDGKVKDDYVATAIEIVDSSGVTFPQLIPDKGISDYLSSVIAGYPTTFFLDSDGKILGTTAGAYNKANWKEMIDKYYKQVTEGGAGK